MYPERVRREALTRLARGQTLSEVSRGLRISRAALRDWRTNPRSAPADRCPRCHDGDLEPKVYAALLGYYLGDGCLSVVKRYAVLRISCDTAWRLDELIGLKS